MPATTAPDAPPPSPDAGPDPAGREATATGTAAWLRLTLTPGIGARTALALLRALGDATLILDTSHARLASIAGATSASALLGADPVREAAVDAALDWVGQPGNHLVRLDDADFPPALLQIADPPPLLYVRGDRSRLARDAIAIVGSRQATRVGADTARAFARALADQGWQIISGLALGIDAAAHEGGLAGVGGTLAVVGTGVDRVYPASNRALAERIVADGAIVSELPLGTGATRSGFPRRNRLIAGLAKGVIVVEAARQSGSLITARLAGEFGREVFAIPGSIHSPLSKGCHALIREGARLVESAQDVAAELGVPQPLCADSPRPTVAPGSAAHDPGLSDVATEVLATIGWDPCAIDTIVDALPYGAATVQSALVELELDRRVERLPDGRIQRLEPLRP